MNVTRSGARLLAALGVAATAVLPAAPALAHDDAPAGAATEGPEAPAAPWLLDVGAWLVDLGDALPADPLVPGDPAAPTDPAATGTRDAAHVLHCGHHTHLDVLHPHYRVEFLYHFGWRGRHYHRVLYHRQLLGLEDRVLTVRCAGEDTAAAARLSRWYGRG